MRNLLILATLIILLLVIRTSFFTVDGSEFVYLTQFGRPVAVYDGANAQEAGLHVKWPWPIQTVQRLDHRVQYFDLAGAEFLTHDSKGNTIDKTLTVDAYVCWRVAGKEGVDRFIRTIGTPDRARVILGGWISSALGAAIGQMELEDLISVVPGKVDRQRERLRQYLLQSTGQSQDAAAGQGGLQEQARHEYGIDIVDVRLRRSNHPPVVRSAIFARIRSERGKKIADYQSEGEKLAKEIESDAQRRVRDIESTAKATATLIQGEADAEADRIRNEAQSQDPQFYAFLKKLEEYQRILGDNKTVLLLSAHRELFDLLLHPPQPGNVPSAKTTAPSPSKRGGS